MRGWIVCLALGFGAALLLSPIYDFNLSRGFLLGLTLCALTSFFFMPRHINIRLWILFMGFLCGLVRAQGSQDHAKALLDSLALDHREMVTLAGKVQEQPRVLNLSEKPNTSFVLETYWVDTDEICWEGKMKIRVSLFLSNRFISIGDQMKFKGYLSRPKQSVNDGGYDEEVFFKRKRVALKLDVFGSPNINFLNLEKNKVSFTIAWLRRSIAQNILHYSADWDGQILTALLVGNAIRMDAAARDLFARTGTSHLLAVSGLHVGLVAGVCWMIASFFGMGRQYVAALVVIAVWVYAFLAGGRAPVLRASVLITFVMLGKIIERSSFSMDILALAFLILLVIKPDDLFSLSFQLSFLAALILIFFAQGREGNQNKQGMGERIIEMVEAGIWATLLTSPLAAATLGIFSSLSVIATIVILPFIYVALLMTPLALLMGLANPFLGTLIYLSLGSLQMSFFILHFLAQIPGAYNHVGKVSNVFLMGYYGLCAVLVWKHFIAKQIGSWAVFAILIGALLSYATIMDIRKQRELLIVRPYLKNGAAAWIRKPSNEGNELWLSGMQKGEAVKALPGLKKLMQYHGEKKLTGVIVSRPMPCSGLKREIERQFGPSVTCQEREEMTYLYGGKQIVLGVRTPETRAFDLFIPMRKPTHACSFHLRPGPSLEVQVHKGNRTYCTLD